MKRSIVSTALVAGFAVAVSLQTASAADPLLTGNVLRVGVNQSGGLINEEVAIPFGDSSGLTYDPTGTGTFPSYGSYGPADFIKPGTPYEFYSAGYNSSWEAGGYYDGNGFGATTTNTSSGSTLSAHTEGSFGLLSLVTDLSFGMNSGTIFFTTKLTNTGTEAISDVVFARGLDPDQGVYPGAGFSTTNTIVNGDLVTGRAPVGLTDWTIGIFSNSSYAHNPSVVASWPNSNPYSLLSAGFSGTPGDYSINMAWDIGTLAAGASAVITYEYRIGPDHESVENPHGVPDAGATIGLLAFAVAGLVAFRRRA